MSIIQRTIFPGCLINAFPVLQGKEGKSKTEYSKQHLPPTLNKYFSDRFDFRQAEEKQVRLIRQMVLIEFGKMIGFKKADQDAAKSFLTATHDNNRGLCKDNLKRRPRTRTFIFTGNHKDFLSAQEENRGFVVIEIKSKLDPALWFNNMPIQDCELTNRDLQFCFAIEKIIQDGWLTFQDGKLAKPKGDMTTRKSSETCPEASGKRLWPSAGTSPMLTTNTPTSSKKPSTASASPLKNSIAKPS